MGGEDERFFMATGVRGGYRFRLSVRRPECSPSRVRFDVLWGERNRATFADQVEVTPLCAPACWYERHTASTEYPPVARSEVKNCMLHSENGRKRNFLSLFDGIEYDELLPVIKYEGDGSPRKKDRVIRSF